MVDGVCVIFSTDVSCAQARACCGREAARRNYVGINRCKRRERLKIFIKTAESRRGIKREVVGAGLCSSKVNDRYLALKHVIKSKKLFAIKAAEYFIFEENEKNIKLHESLFRN